MAYGMQLPQVPFPYFYPSNNKMPSAVPPPSGAPAGPHLLYPKLSTPLNFSKRERPLPDQNQEDIYTEGDRSRPYSSEKERFSSDLEHDDNVDKGMMEESENVEID